MSRPEHVAPAEIYYGEENAARYARNTRNLEIQTRMTERALELLALPESDEPALLLDIGCGSGLSSETISENGHAFIGLDLSRDMLAEAASREVTDGGDLIQADIGLRGLSNFRVGTFDGAISISVIQWLLSSQGGVEPHKKLKTMFADLHRCLKRGARAVFQFYPETAEQIELITACAMKAGFGGGLVVDFPHSAKAKKHYLVVHAGFGGVKPAEMTVQQPSSGVKMEGRARADKGVSKKVITKKSKDWIVAKKERQRRQGHEVREDSKYTGRKRRGKF